MSLFLACRFNGAGMRGRASAILIALTTILTLSTAAQAEDAEWKVGLASVKITPDRPLVMAGYRSRVKPFEKVNVPILGIVENMSYFITPGGERVEIFGHGGGQAEAARQKTQFLGEIPIYTAIREGGDAGVPVVAGAPDTAPAQAFIQVARLLRGKLG